MARFDVTREAVRAVRAPLFELAAAVLFVLAAAAVAGWLAKAVAATCLLAKSLDFDLRDRRERRR